MTDNPELSPEFYPDEYWQGFQPGTYPGVVFSGDGYLKKLERDRRLMRHLDDSVIQLIREQRLRPITDVLSGLLSDADLVVNYRRREILGERPSICDKGHCYCENPYRCGWAHRLGPWDQLTLDVWAAGQEALKDLDDACVKWQDAIANGWPESVVPFDVLSWLPAMMTPSNWLLPPDPALPQFPRTPGLTTAVQWWADCFPQWRGRSSG